MPKTSIRFAVMILAGLSCGGCACLSEGRMARMGVPGQGIARIVGEYHGRGAPIPYADDYQALLNFSMFSDSNSPEAAEGDVRISAVDADRLRLEWVVSGRPSMSLVCRFISRGDEIQIERIYSARSWVYGTWGLGNIVVGLSSDVDGTLHVRTCARGLAFWLFIPFGTLGGPVAIESSMQRSHG